MSKRIVCPYCGNDSKFEEDIDCENSTLEYEWNEKKQDYILVNTEYWGYGKSSLRCSECDRELSNDICIWIC